MLEQGGKRVRGMKGQRAALLRMPITSLPALLREVGRGVWSERVKPSQDCFALDSNC